MLVLLTNATNEYEGLPLAVNVEEITTVYGQYKEGSTSEIETYVYSASTNNTWQVKETTEEVLKKIKAS